MASYRRTTPSSGADGEVRLSELFGEHDTLVIYSFMFPRSLADEGPCPSCTSILDSLDGAAAHLSERVALAVVAKAPLARVRAFAQERGWRHLHLLSSAGSEYNPRYRAENADGSQNPVLNVFTRREGEIRHFWSTELMTAPRETGQDPRHVDFIWPVWGVLDTTPAGRGHDWSPRLG